MKSGRVMNGVVLLLDALGVKNNVTQEAHEFLCKWEILIDKIDIVTNNLFRIGAIQIKHRKPDRFIFGDTLLFVWNVDNFAHDVAGAFCEASYFTAQLLKIGIENNILLRGAISVGEYYYLKKDNLTTFVGPAIADAASWYEDADWFGVMCTPLCDIKIPCYIEMMKEVVEENKQFSFGLEEYCSTENEENYNSDRLNLLSKYSVALKGGNKAFVYTISWPMIVFWEQKGNSTNWLYSNLSNSIIPKGTENKYWNSIAYFESILAKQLKTVV